MRMLALTGLLTLLTCFTTGCVITTPEREGLPTGATLLDSDEGSCDGTVEIESDPDIALDDGESTTIAVGEEDDLDWECLSGSSLHEGGDLDCPAGTDYVRITRDEDEHEFRIECFAG